ncbi:MAG TPA: hypothetical protein VGE72_12215 [Azospirillum sp.]
MAALFWTFAAWYACGVAGFLYWWTEDEPVDGVILLDALAFGLMGPLNLLLGYLIHRLPGDAAAPEEGEPVPVRIRTRDRR